MVLAGRVEREAVEEGSKPEREGVRSALRFCVMESSIVLRDTRRKSAWLGWVSWI